MAEPTEDPAAPNGWMSDVQRALALILIGCLAIVILIVTAKLVWTAPSDTLNDLAKTLLSALVNMGLIALGFFFGSNVSSRQAAVGQQRIIERLAPPAPPAPPGPAATTAWWGKMTDAEKNAVSAAAPSDPRVAAIVSAATAGNATGNDLDYLVGKGLLTPDRVKAIQQG